MNESRRRIISLSVATGFFFGFALWVLRDSPYLGEGLFFGFSLMLAWIGIMCILVLYMNKQKNEKDEKRNEEY